MCNLKHKKWWLYFILVCLLGSIGSLCLSGLCGAIDTITDSKFIYAETTNGIIAYAQENQEMVWISYSGKKYHSNPDCSNMKKPSKISKSDAVNRGRKPCSKCY